LSIKIYANGCSELKIKFTCNKRKIKFLSSLGFVKNQ
jgi:hypothetical protein